MADNLHDMSDVVRDLLEESEEEDPESLFGDETDSDPDFVLEDEDLDDYLDNEEWQRNRHLIWGRNKKTPYIWSTKEPECHGRAAERNLVMHLPAPKGVAKEVRTPENAWKLLIDDVMLEEMTLRTNEEIDRQVQNIVMQSYHRKTCKNEIIAYIGRAFVLGGCAQRFKKKFRRTLVNRVRVFYLQSYYVFATFSLYKYLFAL